MPCSMPSLICTVLLFTSLIFLRPRSLLCSAPPFVKFRMLRLPYILFLQADLQHPLKLKPFPHHLYSLPHLHILKCSDFNSLYCAKKISSLATEFKLSNSEILNISLALNSVSPVSFFAKPYGVNPKFSAIKLFFKPLFSQQHSVFRN